MAHLDEFKSRNVDFVEYPLLGMLEGFSTHLFIHIDLAIAPVPIQIIVNFIAKYHVRWWEIFVLLLDYRFFFLIIRLSNFYGLLIHDCRTHDAELKRKEAEVIDFIWIFVYEWSVFYFFKLIFDEEDMSRGDCDSTARILLKFGANLYDSLLSSLSSLVSPSSSFPDKWTAMKNYSPL